MEEKMMAAKAAISAAMAAVSAFLGWKGVMVLIWVLCMALDYISGTAAACKGGKWSSKVAREGLLHKVGMILVVIVAVAADIALSVAFAQLDLGFTWPTVVMPLVLAWYIITEIGSILENATKMGAKVPGWLLKLMEVSLKAVDSAGGDATDDTENK